MFDMNRFTKIFLDFFFFFKLKSALLATGCNDLTSHKKCAPGLKCRNTVCVLDKGMLIYGSIYIL